MRTIQDYRNIYRNIANKLNITGDSTELLVQLLANASYIDEVENINYALEGSLEKCSLINSKIQHCEDDMYSVFRGRCPRVLLRFKPTKYFSFKPFDRIISSNSFSVYYLGYYKVSDEEEYTDEEEIEERSNEETEYIPVEEGFIYAPCTITPNDSSFIIIGLIAPDIIEKTWQTTANNTYYVECDDKDLSNDMFVYTGDSEEDKEYLSVTRTFSEHILEHRVFDLTITDFGSRLYIADVFRSMEDDISDDEEEEEIDSEDNDINNSEDANITLHAQYFRYSHLSTYNTNELKKMNLSGAQMTTFSEKEFDDGKFLTKRGYTELAPGIVVIEEVSRDDINTIHYKANRDRFVSTIMRTNSDVGTILEETYPEKVMSGGTNFMFGPVGDQGTSVAVTLYYVPNNITNTLTNEEKADFVSTKKAYYVTDEINIVEGIQYIAIFNIDLELYQPQYVENDVKDILSTFEKKFNIDLESSKDNIRTLISKISNVKQVRELEITYLNSGDGLQVENDSVLYMDESENLETRVIKPNIYFKIEYNINSIVQSKS